MDEDSKITVKIVIIGEAGVGKTSLMSKFVFDTFDDQMQPTIGCDIHNKSVTIDGHKLEVRLWDTAGCERFQTMLPLYYRGCHGAILVYDVTRKDTFNKLRDWLLELQNNLTNDDAVVMIVGNKIDKTGRQVSKEAGNEYAKQRSALFIETSAKTSEGVSIAFEELLLKIMQTPGLLNRGTSGINIGDNRGNQSGGACNWVSNILSSLWSTVYGSG
jgi:Ras-related protein Rab-18